MMLTLRKGMSLEEMQALQNEMDKGAGSKPHIELLVHSKKGSEFRKYVGCVHLTEDPLAIQRKMRYGHR